MLVPSMGTAAIWQTKTANPMPAGARTGRWAVLCALAWSVAANTTKTRRKVRMASINHPALWGSPVRSTFEPPFAAWNPEWSVCTKQMVSKHLERGLVKYKHAQRMFDFVGVFL